MEPENYDSLAHELLETNKCYFLDCGDVLYVWMGRNTSMQERKGASEAAEKFLSDSKQTKTHVIKVIEGFENVAFKSKFKEWPLTPDMKLSSVDGQGKVPALFKHRGLNVKGLVKAAPVKEESQSYIDCTGNLQVWRVNDTDKVVLASSDQSKFYTGDCYIFQYTYPGVDKDECLFGTWIGKKSIEEDMVTAVSLAIKMVESANFQAVQARLYEGKELIQFFVIFQSLQVFKVLIHLMIFSNDSYSEDGLALFRIQGSGLENMQAIQVEPVASSLNSCYCYILHDGNTVFTWAGNLTSPLDQELMERQLDVIKPNMQSRSQKEGSETDQFWSLIGGKSEYSSQTMVKEIHHFTQDDLMTDDVFILDCRTSIFVWVGQQVDVKVRLQAFNVGEKFIVLDFLMENLAHETPIFTVMEGGEPPFFTRFFTSDPAKSLMHVNSYQKKPIVKGGGTAGDSREGLFLSTSTSMTAVAASLGGTATPAVTSVSSVLENADLLGEILLRIAFPNRLVRAAAVCKFWLSIASDPVFLKKFEMENPPCALGFYVLADRLLHPLFIPVGVSDHHHLEINPLLALASSQFEVWQDVHVTIWDCRNGKLLVEIGDKLEVRSYLTRPCSIAAYPQSPLKVILNRSFTYQHHEFLPDDGGDGHEYYRLALGYKDGCIIACLSLLCGHIWVNRNSEVVDLPKHATSSDFAVPFGKLGNRKVYLVTTSYLVIILDIDTMKMVMTVRFISSISRQRSLPSTRDYNTNNRSVRLRNMAAETISPETDQKKIQQFSWCPETCCSEPVTLNYASRARRKLINSQEGDYASAAMTTDADLNNKIGEAASAVTEEMRRFLLFHGQKGNSRERIGAGGS
ncbi:hypothetical protein U9M48_005621 [Paspalum notatum var. saurae]|uniref:Uncharacterized protein n=1 Tax=Paspalum notatum var. saurae TaxID=547442 RepID=A0AAQ3SFK8_PASNO